MEKATETEIENRIQAAGATTPRLTPEAIDALIVGEDYHVFPGTTVTVCCLTMRNGYNTVGHSAAASPENFREDIGRDVARRNAREKIWPLAGYLLKQQLHEAAGG